MLTIDDVKKILLTAGCNYSKEEIEALLDFFTLLALEAYQSYNKSDFNDPNNHLLKSVNRRTG